MFNFLQDFGSRTFNLDMGVKSRHFRACGVKSDFSTHKKYFIKPCTAKTGALI